MRLFSGKSTWCSRFPKAIFLAVEDGTSGIDCVRIPSTEFTKAVHVLQALNEISESDDYDTVVVDSVDWFERQIENELVEADFDMGYGKGAVEISRRFKKFLDLLDKCVDSGKTVIMIAHQEVREARDAMGNTWDQIRPKLGKRVTEMVLEYADEALLAKREDFVRKEKGSFGKEVAIASTAGRRVLKTDSHPSYVAGCRLNLPATINMNDPITPFLVKESQ